MIVCHPLLAAYSGATIGIMWRLENMSRRCNRDDSIRLAAATGLAFITGMFSGSPLDPRLLLMQALAPAASSDAATGEVCDALWIPGFAAWFVIALLSQVRLPDPVAFGILLLTISAAHTGRLAGGLGGADVPALIMSGLFLDGSSLVLLIAYACLMAFPSASMGSERGVPFIPYVFSAATMLGGTI